MKKLTLILAAMVLTASQAFGQCGKCGYEVKAENAYTNYNVRYASTERSHGCQHKGSEDIRFSHVYVVYFEMILRHISNPCSGCIDPCVLLSDFVG